jgi:acyl-CoA thioester hydrolase
VDAEDSGSPRSKGKPVRAPLAALSREPPGAQPADGVAYRTRVAVRFILGDAAAMSQLTDTTELRVRYSETDQMGTFYNSRALEWFECARTELMRHKLGMSYAALEAKGVFLPLVEAHLEFQGGARYDDLLDVASAVDFSGRARLRFEVQIRHRESGRPVVSGYTVHAFTGRQGKATRPPSWFVAMMEKAGVMRDA